MSKRFSFFVQLALVGLVFIAFGSAVIAQAPATQAVTAEKLDSLRAYLNKSEGQRFSSFEEIMLRAERSFDVLDYSETQRLLSRAALAGVPNSRWFELRYLSLLGESKQEAADKVLAEGFSQYPYSERLARLVGNQQLKGDVDRKALMKSKYPDNIKFELASKLAFKQGDIVSGLLDAEQAFYSDDKLQLDTSLRRALIVFYKDLLLSQGDIQPYLSEGIYADSSFAKAYLNCLSEAAGKVYVAAENFDNELFKDDVYLSRVRVSALRICAKRGYLAKWKHPLLVDLYVLDQAGFLDETSLILLEPSFVYSYQKNHPGKLEQAVKYLDTAWSEDVGAFLSRF